MTDIKQWLRTYWYLGVLLVVGLGGWWWLSHSKPVTVSTKPNVVSESAMVSSSNVTQSGPKAGYVHLKGAVKRPGLYPVTTTTRWDAVVKAAGGLLPQADISQVNLAKIASDQETLLIPDNSAENQSAAVPNVTASSTTSGTINLNTADATALQTLNGVGPKKAQDIIAYRDSHGGFKTLEELKSVPGIGDKTFEKLAPQLTVGP